MNFNSIQYDKSKLFFDFKVTAGPTIAVIKKVAKDSGAGGSFGPVLSRKKKKSDVLAKSVLVEGSVIKTTGNHSRNSETGNTTESESVNMEEECLIEETNINYDKRDVFDGGNSNQTLKSSGIKIKTKKVLGKINFEDNFDNDNFLDESVFLPSPFLLKPLDYVSVHKSFTLDIDLVAVAGKSSQKKLNFIKKIFSDVNGFGGVSTPSKFGGIIHVTFTSEIAMIAAGKLAHDCGVVVNTNLKCPVNNCTNWDIVIKKIPVGTLIKAVRAAVSEFEVVVSIKMQLVRLWQKAIVTLGDSDQADLLASKWFILIRKDVFKGLLYTFPVETNAHDLWDFIGSVDGKTCVIEHNSVNYTQAHCTTVCFEFESDLNQALANTLVINGVRLCWSHLFAVLYSSCNSLGHTSRNCKLADVFSSLKGKRAFLSAQDWFRLVKIYEKKSVPVFCFLAFSGKTWASVVGSIPLGTFFGYDSQLGSIRNGKFLPPVINDLEKRLVSIESNLVSLAGQIGELAKSPGCQLPVTSPSQNQEENIVMGVGSSDVTSDKTAAILGSTASSEVVKLENMLEGLSASVISLSAHLDGLKIATCNVHGLNNLAKQDNVIHWHKDMNNLVSIFTELKLKEKVCPWLTDKFDGVRVFTSGLDFGSLGAGVLIIVNSSLAKHVCKVSEVPSQLLFIKLLFKNKLSVSILGLYAGASSVVQFSQAGEINFLIAKAINESSFCVSFKKCLELGLVNSLIGSLTIKMSTWTNSRGVMKTINYVFILPNLVNSLVHRGVLDISEYFDTDHQTVSVSVGLGGLLDIHLFSFRKQVNKDHWKFDFKDATATNTTMFSGAFGVAVKFSDLGIMWDVIHKIMVFSAGGAFKKRWFKGFDTVCNKMSSRFHKLELLVSKLVKAFHLSFSVSFASLLDTWNNFNSAGALTVRSMFLSGVKFDDICSALAKARKLYCSSKLLESKCAEESHIRQTITNRIKSFELDKSHIIRSMLECSFHKVVLDHLVMDNELVLEPDLVKSKSPNFVVGSVIENALEKNQELCGRTESQAGFSTFLAVGAFVDDIIWVGSSQAATQHILNIAILKKVVSDKQFLYLVSAVLHPIIGYRMQFGNIPVDVCDKWDALIHKDLKLKAGLLMDFPSDTIHYPSFYGLKSFSQCQSESKVASLISFVNSGRILGRLFSHSVSNNFLAGMVCILLDCNLSLGGSLASAFWFRDRISMSVILSKSLFFKFLPSLWHFGIAFMDQLCDHHDVVFSWCTFKWWKRLDPYDPVPKWFGLFVAFLMTSHSSSTVSVGASPLNFCESDDFMAAHGHLSQVDINSLSVYMDSSLKNLGTVNCRAGAAVFFEDIYLGLGVSAIALALECVSAAHSIDLFLNSQGALDACRSELSLVCSDFRNQYWHKVKSHFGILENDCADSIADTTSLFGWYLFSCMDKHFLLADGSVVSDVYHAVCHVRWEVSSSSGFLASSLRSDVDWLSSSRVWHSDLNMATGFTSRLTADTRTYLMKALHHRLPVAVQKCIYNKCYSSVLCLYCGKIEVSDHVFSCVVDDLARHQLMSICASDLLVFSALYKSFEAVTVFHDPKIAGVKITDFMRSLCSTFKNDIWLVCIKHCVFMEKNSLIPADRSIPIPVFGLVSRLLPGVIKLLGITEVFDILFGFCKSCLFFSGIGDMVSVNIVV
ncbi:hypothetical protein G9A89_014620 [Geosiphon pyriformis]|nr:hypothetical protein G9A89_014620 [Geosiphon pyriformis]